jgi:DNA-binding transcriptional regulator YdaS (Cro superfamily)
MRLKQYLQSTRLIHELMLHRQLRFARSIGVSWYTLRHWLERGRGISDKNKLRIVRVTQGAVRYEDMIDWSPRRRQVEPDPRVQAGL